MMYYSTLRGEQGADDDIGGVKKKMAHLLACKDRRPSPVQSAKKMRQKLLGFIPTTFLCRAGGGADNESKMADDDEEDAFTPVIFFADKPASPSSPCCCLIDPFASIEEEKEEGERSSTNQTQPLVPVRLFPNIDASFESIRAHTEEVCEDELDDKTAKNDPFTPLIEFDCPMFTFPTDGLEGTSIAMSDGIFTFQSFGDTLKLSKEGSVEVYPRPFGFKRSARFTTYDWSQGN
mmetsp:Transcript_14156/g.33108  ORF Transcript_14156/g.33108 Transcript_14156/m.33108 type:complete len:234 (+) Transcript_14156:233-934(+)